MYINKKIAYFTDLAVPSTDEQAEIDALETKLYIDADGDVNDHLKIHVRRKNFKIASIFDEGEVYGGDVTEDFDAVAAFYDDVPALYEGTAFPLAGDDGVETLFLSVTPATASVADVDAGDTFDITKQFYASVSDGISAATDVTTSVAWTSSDTDLVTIGAATGLATVAATTSGGSVTITATYKTFTATATLTIV